MSASLRLSRNASASIIVVLVTATACGPGERAADALPSVDTTTIAAIIAPPVEVLPDSILVRRGACPFECCVYRGWVAQSVVPVFAAERSVADTISILQPGDTITALTGNVHITSLGRVVVTRDVYEFNSSKGGHLFVPGDTLFVLDYLGEGFYNAWMDGAIYQPERFWVDEAEYNEEKSAAFVVGDYETEWWVQARLRSGLEGWIWMMEGTAFDGADRCA